MNIFILYEYMNICKKWIYLPCMNIWIYIKNEYIYHVGIYECVYKINYVI